MVQGQPNKLAEMEVFMSVAQAGSFTAAARLLHMTPSAVSKLIARLEKRLSVRLFNRSTRRLQLTVEGVAFFDRTRNILAQIEEAEQCAVAGEAPAGNVRVSVNIAVGLRLLLPRLPAFLERYPHVDVDVSLTDRVVDLLADRTDLALRSGPLPDSSLRARKLGRTKMRIVAAPEYLARRGRPSDLKSLDSHARLGFSYVRSVDGWTLEEGGTRHLVRPNARVQVSDGEALRRVCLEGAGLARLADFHVRADIEAGRLEPVLAPLTKHDFEDIHAVFIGDGGPVPSRVRALVDYLAETIDPADI